MLILTSDNLAARNETQIDQNDIVSSIVSPPMGLVNNFGSASVEVGEEIANSSKQENEFIENTSYSVQEETDNVIEKSEIGMAKVFFFLRSCTFFIFIYDYTCHILLAILINQVP